MELHVLNGDALAQKFTMSNNVVICREALIDGPVNTEDEEGFWKARSHFISETYNSSNSEYQKRVVEEYKKLKTANAKEINLWFEHDLFCQTNLWFTIAFLTKHKKPSDLYIVYPSHTDLTFSGFGRLTRGEITELSKSKIFVSEDDMQLAISLWDAYRKSELDRLSTLASVVSPCFPRLKQICEAEIERHSSPLNRPNRVLKRIVNSGVKDFQDIFNTFQETESIYGFGDQQVKRMLNLIK
jgi:hypothetical protein